MDWQILLSDRNRGPVRLSRRELLPARNIFRDSIPMPYRNVREFDKSVQRHNVQHVFSRSVMRYYASA